MLRYTTWEPVTFTAGDGTAVTFEVKRLTFLEQKVFAVSFAKIQREEIGRHAVIAHAEMVERQRLLIERLNGSLKAAGHDAIPIGDDLDATAAAINARLAELGVDDVPLTAEEIERLFTPDASRQAARQAAIEAFWGSLDGEWLTQVFRDYVRNVCGVAVDDHAVTTGEELLSVADASLVLFVLQAIDGRATLSATQKKTSSSPSTSGPVATSNGASAATPVAPEGGTAPGTAPDACLTAPSSGSSAPTSDPG